ncbi:ZN687 protein, partial [Columbina picui]|nr:ZN687 protein [Columbina picui]
SPKGLAAALGDSPLDHLKSVTVRYAADDSPMAAWPGSDPNLGGGTGSIPEVKHSPVSPHEPFYKPPSPVVQSPRLPPSPKQLDGLKEEHQALEKSMGSPQSMSSAEEEEEEEDNNNDSPSSNSSRPLKVRIKTIKTSCGSITRTVTRVSSDSEPGSAKGPAEQSSQDAALEAAAEKDEGIALEAPKEKTELSSPLKTTEGPKIVSVQLGNGTKLKGTVLPVSTIQNASSAMLIAASVAQQKSVVLPAKTGKAVTKNIINLVPQSLPKADTRTNASTVTQTATVTTTANQKVNGTTVVMVQPQKPSPTVAGTVISRSQSSLVEAFNKILNSKNLLPTYKPNLNPPADASLALPPFGYRCLECGDSFALEKSLARHYDRRSMRIEVTCNHCTKRLVFFNKCSLLLHAREHKDKGLVMQCSHLVMRPIALDQMIGQPDITPLVSVTSFPAGKVTGVTQDALVAANGAQELPILPLGSGLEQSSYSCFRCLECKEQCKDKAGLAAHFQQAVTAGTTSSTVCTTCPMIMSNRCSFNAHQRMHKNRPPHVCPECGGNFLLANFETHLKEACLHFSRRNTHQPQKPKEDLAKKVAVLLTPKQEPVETPVSKISEESSSSTEEDEPPSSPELRKTKRSRFQRKTGTKSKGSGWTCGVCHSWFPERDEYVSHMKKDHGKSVKKFPCHLCERSFCSAPSLRRHVRVNHEGIKRVYPCRYCTEGKRTFSSRLILEKHIQVRHGIKVTDQPKSQEV